MAPVDEDRDRIVEDNGGEQEFTEVLVSAGGRDQEVESR